MRGFVIGNGESRMGFDLNTLVGHGPIYGCNALYRDFYPNVLIAVDQRMIKEIQRHQLPLSVEFIYRIENGNNTRELVSSHDEVLVDNGHAAGPTALDIMCRRYPDMEEIFLIGFDIYSKNGKINNLYKGTDCYSPSDNKATYTKNWVEKLRRTFVLNPEIKFMRVCDDELNNEYRVPSWVGLDNVYYMNYAYLNSLLT